MEKGLFITIEGPDGGGKSTQIQILCDLFTKMGREVIVTREPGGTPFGEAIRKVLLEPCQGADLDPMAELFLFAASRAQHVQEKILPAIARGKVVIASRYIDASMAYQGYGRGLELEKIEQVNHLATNGLKPDLTLILDIDSETGLKRAFSVDEDQMSFGLGDRIESAGLKFHQKVRAGYLEMAKQDPQRFVIIDSNQTIESVAKDINACISKKFGI